MTFSEFLERYALLISVIMALFIFLLIIIFVVAPKFKRPTPKVVVRHDKALFITALGGENNIKLLTVRGSRVTVELNDQTLIEEETLKKYGVSRIITMENKVVLLVNEEIAESLNELR